MTRDDSDDTRPAPAPAPHAVERGKPVQAHGLTFDVAAASGQGPRPENQDAYAVSGFPALGLVAVADGMGGERAGRMAADTALQAVTAAAPIRSLDAARYAVRSADEAVARVAREAPGDREGMGCALALLSLTADRAGEVGWVTAHVGDVRVLSRSPDGVVRLETRDHTPAFARWEAGEIALDEIPDSPGANRLQRAVGRGGEADAGWIPVRPGWSYLLVSDGVTKAVRLDELGRFMAMDSAEAACQAVARKVEERGPDDNYTVVAVRVLDDGTATQEAPRRAHAGAAASASSTGSAASSASGARREDPRGPFNIPDNVNRPSRSGAGVATALAVLGLLLAAFATWTALQGRGQAATRAQVDSLARQVDSLRALVPPPAFDTAADSLAAARPGDVVPVGPAVPPAAPPGAARNPAGTQP